MIDSVYDRLQGLARANLINLTGVQMTRSPVSDMVFIMQPLVNLAETLRKQGFTVITTLADSLSVQLVRAEDKLKRNFIFDSDRDDPHHTGDIIMAGPLTRTPGDMPRRIVLRYNTLASSYVVHEQVIPDGIGESCRPHFNNGNYFSHQSDRPAAMAKFIERMMNLDKMAYHEFYRQGGQDG